MWHPLNSEFLSTTQKFTRFFSTASAKCEKTSGNFSSSIWTTRFVQKWNCLKVLVIHLWRSSWTMTHFYFPLACFAGIKAYCINHSREKVLNVKAPTQWWNDLCSLNSPEKRVNLIKSQKICTPSVHNHVVDLRKSEKGNERCSKNVNFLLIRKLPCFRKLSWGKHWQGKWKFYESRRCCSIKCLC